MKFRGVIGIILTVLLLSVLIDTDLSYDEKKYIALNDDNNIEVIELNNTTFSTDSNKDSEVIEYINNSLSTKSIGIGNIDINCIGSGEYKDDDERLSKENLNLNVYFTLTPNGEKYSSLFIKRNEKIYIHIDKEYIGKSYPKNEVQCNFYINS